MRSFLLVASFAVVFIVGLAIGFLIRSGETPKLVDEFVKLRGENAKLTAERLALTEELSSLKKRLNEKAEKTEPPKLQSQAPGGSEEEFDRLKKELADTKEQLRQTREFVGFLESKFPLYRVVRNAPLIRNPVEGGQILVRLSPGHRIRVERVVDEKWLKVLYSRTNPPGYIRKEDTVQVLP